MRKKTSGEPRESALASGWTVEAEPADAAPAEAGPAASAPSAAESRAGEGSPASEAVGAVAADSAAEGDAAELADDGPAQLSNAALVLLGVFGGLYLLYAWVWLSWAQFYASANAELASASGALGGALQQVVFWAAPLAPLLWFLAALVLNRGAGIRRLALWIVIGAVVLLPLPVFGGGGA